MSTNLYRQQRLGRDQLLEIGAHGFEAVELVAAPGHVEPENPAAVADLQQWLAEARLDVSSVRGPTGTPPPPPEQLEAALFLARRIRVPVFVMAVEGTRDKARRNVERVATLAAPLGVTVAVEGPEHSPPGSAVHMVEDELRPRSASPSTSGGRIVKATWSKRSRSSRNIWWRFACPWTAISTGRR